MIYCESHERNKTQFNFELQWASIDKLKGQFTEGKKMHIVEEDA